MAESSNSKNVDARFSTFHEIHGHQFVVGHRTRTDSPDLNLSLAPVDAACNRRGPVSRCLDGTREELISRVMSWIDGDPDHPICWLHGPAGSGKSALSQTVGEYCDSRKQIAASFFFMRGAQNRSTATHLVPTLAYQLSISVPATRPLLAQALQTDRSIPHRSLRYQFEKLMIEPTLAVRNRAALTTKSTAVIIIDALDECGKESIVEFIETITNACPKFRPFPFRIFMTSRNEKHLRKKLEASAARFIYPLDIQNFDAGDDIRRFFQDRCSTIYEENLEVMRDMERPWPSDSDVEALVEKAGGSFGRASELISFIDNETDEPDRQLAVVLGRKPGRRQQSSSGIFKIIRWPSRSSQLSAKDSPHVISPSTVAAVENPSASGVAGGPRAKRLRINTSDAPPNTRVLNESPVPQDEDASVETTTLEGLIDNLILPFVRNPEEYRDTFFTTYTAFTTADEVFQSLVRRFSDAETSHPQHYTHICIHIIEVMKYWVTTPYLEIDTNVLTRMKELAASIQTPGVIKKLAQELHSATAGRIISPSRPHTKTSQKPTVPTKARDLAIALLILEEDKYSRILQADYIPYFQQKPGENHVRDVFETNHTITYWVQQAVLNCDELGARSGLLKFFISTAEESRKLGNFASMSAILGALRSEAITRLTLTYEELPNGVKDMMEGMEIPEGSTNLPCVPVLDAHITDMRTAFSEAKEAVDIHGTTTINFSKWTKFHTCLKAVLRHKLPDVSKYRRASAGVLAYLNQQLSGVSPGPPMNLDLEKRSSKLFEQEEKIRNQPIDRFRRAGVR